MIGLDTNVLVRYLVGDDREQATRAAACIRKAGADGKGCYINRVVMCELVWALESAYEYEKTEIADVLDKILATKQFEIEEKDTVRRAIREYRQGSGDFSDYLIGTTNEVSGCEYTATFDRALRTCASFLVIS